MLKALGGFNPNYGMNGNVIAYGEEINLIEKIRSLSEDNCLYYEPRLYIEHLVRQEKTEWVWIIRHRFAHGKVRLKIFPSKNEPISYFRLGYRIFGTVLLLLNDLLFCVLLRNRKKYPRFQNYYYEHTTNYITSLGQFFEQVKDKVHYYNV